VYYIVALILSCLYINNHSIDFCYIIYEKFFFYLLLSFSSSGIIT